MSFQIHTDTPVPRRISLPTVSALPEIRRAALFGSRAKNSAKPGSDWDVLLEVVPDTRSHLFGLLRSLPEIRQRICQVDDLVTTGFIKKSREVYLELAGIDALTRYQQIASELLAPIQRGVPSHKIDVFITDNLHAPASLRFAADTSHHFYKNALQFFAPGALLNFEIFYDRDQVPTEWTVIAGVSCSGKTTSVNDLEALSFPVIREVEQNTRAEMTNGKPGVSLDFIKFRTHCYRRSLELEEAALREGKDGEQIVLENCAFTRGQGVKVLGGDINGEAQNRLYPRYKRILLLDKLRFVRQKDDGNIRPFRDEEYRERVSRKMREDFEEAGYSVDVIPVMNRSDRLKYMLEVMGVARN